MHVKGLELPAYSPRASKGMALAYATSDRGGCHLRGYPAMQELLGMRGGADPLQSRGKAQLVVDSQDEISVVDSSDICLFGTFGFTLREIYRMVNAATGFGYGNEAEMKRLGERVYNLTRLFNMREGLDRGDDTLPPRCLREPMPDGPAKGEVVDLDPMLNSYYEIRGWDENGAPTGETLERLALSKI
jgi:aldehyde:ferredoxin oxidoreductase